MTLKKTLGIVVLGLVTALALYDKREEQDYVVTRTGNSISVRESEYPGNAQRIWYDEGTDGKLEYVASAMATSRGFGWMGLKKGEKGFDEAAEHYRTKIFPHIVE